MIHLTQRIILPRPSVRFTFIETPGGSYAKPGEIYTCMYGADRDEISLTNFVTRSGTFDRLLAWRYARWRYVPGCAPYWVDPPDRVFGPWA